MAVLSLDRAVETTREAANLGEGLVQWALAWSPFVPSREPTTADKVTPEFLTRVFTGPGPLHTFTAADSARGAVVEAVEQVGETRGTTNRRRLRIMWNEAGQEAGLPERIFVKSTSTSAKNRTQVAALDMAVNESRFYSTARNDLGDVAPVAYYSSAGLGGRHLLLLEDLWQADHPPFKGPGEAVAFCRAMMSTLAELHATFWESPRFRTDLSWAKTMTRRPGFPIMRNWFRKARAKLAEQADDHGLPPEARRLAMVLNEHDRELEEEVIGVAGITGNVSVHVIVDILDELDEISSDAVAARLAEGYTVDRPEIAPATWGTPAFPDSPQLSQLRVFTKHMVISRIIDGEITPLVDDFVDVTQEFELNEP